MTPNVLRKDVGMARQPAPLLGVTPLPSTAGASAGDSSPRTTPSAALAEPLQAQPGTPPLLPCTQAAAARLESLAWATSNRDEKHSQGSVSESHSQLELEAGSRRAATGGAVETGGRGSKKKVVPAPSVQVERPHYPRPAVPPTVIVRVPIRTVSGMNVREHWSARARRVKGERWAVGMVLNPLPRPGLPCDVALVRLGPGQRRLDDDNLRAALKGVRDEVARWLGVDDGSALVRWHYGQERSHEWAVAVFVRDVGSW